jgi:hypothetical protein
VIGRKTFDDESLHFERTPEKVEIHDRRKAYIDRDIFTDRFRDTFMPEVAARREKCNCQGPAFLSMENCTAHSGEAFDEMCAEHIVTPIYIPRHSSNQLQMLSLSIFAVTKQHIAGFNKLEQVNTETNHVNEILQGFYASATPANIVASFRNVTLSLLMDVQTRAILCKITPERARCLIHQVTSLEPRLEINEGEEERRKETRIIIDSWKGSSLAGERHGKVSNRPKSVSYLDSSRRNGGSKTGLPRSHEGEL